MVRRSPSLGSGSGTLSTPTGSHAALPRPTVGGGRYHEATVVGIVQSVTDAFTALDEIVETSEQHRCLDDWLVLCVVDEKRQPVLA